MTTIRPGRPADRSQLRQIQQATLPEPWPELLTTALAGPPPLFVLDDGSPIGYAIVVAADGQVYIPELAVRPERQREGHGSRLLCWLFEEFADHSEIRLTVQAADDRAQAFYATHGFEQIDSVDDHFESGDGLVLARPLDDD